MSDVPKKLGEDGIIELAAPDEAAEIVCAQHAHAGLRGFYEPHGPIMFQLRCRKCQGIVAQIGRKPQVH